MNINDKVFWRWNGDTSPFFKEGVYLGQPEKGKIKILAYPDLKRTMIVKSREIEMIKESAMIKRNPKNKIA